MCSACRAAAGWTFGPGATNLATAVRFGVKIVVLVLTDNDLALIRIKQQKKGNPIYGTPVRATGSVGGDNLFRVPVLSADNAAGLRQALDKAFKVRGPVVVQAMIDSREYDRVVLKKDKP